MKDRTKNMIERMTIPERLEVLKELGLSTPEILNYLIESHDRGIKNNTVVSDNIRNTWVSIRNQLQNILDIDFQGWKP